MIFKLNRRPRGLIPTSDRFFNQGLNIETKAQLIRAKFLLIAAIFERALREILKDFCLLFLQFLPGLIGRHTTKVNAAIRNISGNETAIFFAFTFLHLQKGAIRQLSLAGVTVKTDGKRKKTSGENQRADENTKDQLIIPTTCFSTFSAAAF